MKHRLFRLLGIEPGEESLISLLLTQSVFIGVFFGTFDISAHSFFLSLFDEKMMARGYVLSGLAGIILTSLYTRLQVRIRFSSFAVLNLSFVTLLTFILWALLMLSPSGPVIWLVFILFGPLNILAMLGFWGTAGRLFNLRQGKRLFGIVDAGLIIGMILSSYAVPVLMAVRFRPHNILLISAAAVLSSAVIQVLARPRFSNATAGKEGENELPGKRKPVFSLLRRDRYIRTMAAFIALSVMTAFFIQYSFMAVTRAQYPAEADMARFLGLFTGSMMAFTLLIKIFVFSYLIRNYGLRTCLAISPVLIILFTVAAVLLGLVKGFTPAAGFGFILFFIILALSRFFSKALKDSIESPSLKVIYQTIGEDMRYGVQSTMDGTVNETAALASGLLLAGLGIPAFISLIYFPIVLLLIAGLWILAAVRLYSLYRNSIRNALDRSQGENGEKPAVEVSSGPVSRFTSSVTFRNDYLQIITGKTDMLRDRGSLYFEELLKAAGSGKDINLIPALKKASSFDNLPASLRERMLKEAESLELLASGLVESDDAQFTSLQMLSGTRTPQAAHLLRLLRDNSTDSKRLALFMIGKFRIRDMLQEVCTCLNNPALEADAVNVLRSFGSDAGEELRRFYLSSSGNVEISCTILRILAENNTPSDRALLFAGLWSGSRTIRELALKKLAECGFEPSESEKDKLHQLISDVAGIMTWNISARISLKRQKDVFMAEELEKEIGRWNRFLFDLLSLTYDPSSLDKIRKNLEAGTIESVNYALEMIDMVIDETIKPKVVPLLDLIPDEERARQLFHFFPGVIRDYNHLIEELLNRDYNLLGIWIRACALRNMKSIQSGSLGESVTALLFSHEAILQEESAALLARSEGNLFESTATRINADTRERLRRITKGDAAMESGIYEKTRFLARCFPDVEEEDLLPLAGSLIHTEKSTKRTLPGKGGYILWKYMEEKASVVHEPGIITEMSYVLPLQALEAWLRHSPGKTGTVLQLIEKYEE
jgi:ATP/ADP translocase